MSSETGGGQEPSVPSVFSQEERRDIVVIVDAIIPRTDTPGAVDAGVPAFLDLMVSRWLSSAERSAFLSAFAGARARVGGSFRALSPQALQAALVALDRESAGADWFEEQDILAWNADAPFFCQVKHLTALGFLLSEAGSTNFLRASPMGTFDGDAKLEAGESAYASDIKG